MTVATLRNKIRYALIARTAAKNILLPEFSKGIFLKPFGNVIRIQPAKRGFAARPVNDDDIFWCELVQEWGGLGRNDDLLVYALPGSPDGLAEQVSKKGEGIWVKPKFRFVEEHSGWWARLEQDSSQTDEA